MNQNKWIPFTSQWNSNQGHSNVVVFSAGSGPVKKTGNKQHFFRDFITLKAQQMVSMKFTEYRLESVE